MSGETSFVVRKRMDFSLHWRIRWQIQRESDLWATEDTGAFTIAPPTTCSIVRPGRHVRHSRSLQRGGGQIWEQTLMTILVVDTAVYNLLAAITSIVKRAHHARRTCKLVNYRHRNQSTFRKQSTGKVVKEKEYNWFINQEMLVFDEK